MSETTNQHSETAPHKAGLFDIRVIIGALIGLYGVVLLLTGLVSSDQNVDNSKPINIWTGLALLVVAAGFVAWARLRPIVVPEETAGGDDRPAHH